MRTLVLGASGLLGRYLRKEFAALGEAVGTRYHQDIRGLIPLNLAQPAQVEALVESFRPETILLAGGLTNVDFCEAHPDLSHQVNVEGVGAVARAAQEVSARLVYFSTDYVFDGEAGPYPEEAVPNPLNVYGSHKLEAEKTVLSSGNTHLVVRTSGLYGWQPEGKNFVLQLLRKFRTAEKAKLFSDQFYTPTYAPNLAAATRALVEEGARGLFHAAGPDWINRLELGKAVSRVFGMEHAVLESVKSAELPQKTRRPLQAGLRIEKLRKTVPTRMWGIEEGLEQMRAAMEGQERE